MCQPAGGLLCLCKEEEEEELELSQQDSSKKKIGKWERRQRRIAAASKASCESVAEATPTEEDFLQLVEGRQAERGSESRTEVLPPSKKRLKIRKDGSAVQVQNLANSDLSWNCSRVL